MKFRLLTLILFFNLHLRAQTDSLFIDPVKRDNIENFKTPVSAQRQIITAQQIKLSTCNRLSDVLQLIDGWTFASVNGDRWYAQANGTSSYHSQNWVLMVNGQKVVVNQYEAVNLNLLGIPVHDIERVEVINTPGIYLNEYSDKGLIHIITKKMPEGFFEKAFINQGYSSQTDGEVGINFSNTLGYAGKRNQFKLNTTYQEYFARDESVRKRYLDEFPTPITPVTVFSPINNSLDANIKLFAVRPELRIDRGRWQHLISGNYSFSNDFTYFSTNLDEVNNDQQYMQGSYLLTFNQNEKHHYRLSFQYSDLRYQKVNFTPMIERENQADVNLSHTYHFTKRKQAALWRNGIAVQIPLVPPFVWNEWNGMRSGTMGGNLFKPYTTLSIPVSRKSIFNTDAMLVYSSENRLGYKASVGIFKRVDVITSWNLVSSYSQRISEEEHHIDAVLFDRVRATGLPWWSMLRSPYEFGRPQQFTTDFYYNLTIGNNLKFVYNLGLKSLWGQFVHDNTDGLLFNNDYLKYNGEMHNLVNRIYMYYDVFTNMVFQFHYMRTDKLSGDDILLQTIPKHKFSAAFEYRLPKKFKIYSRLNAQSKTVWKSAVIENLFWIKDGYTPEMWIWDAGIIKPIIKDKLQFNIAVRNLLNTREQYHPLGANLGLSVFASVLLNLEAINFKKKQ